MESRNDLSTCTACVSVLFVGEPQKPGEISSSPKTLDFKYTYKNTCRQCNDFRKPYITTTTKQTTTTHTTTITTATTTSTTSSNRDSVGNSTTETGHFKGIEVKQLLDRLENSFRRLFSNKENAERLNNMFKVLRCNQLRESYDAVERNEEWRVEEKEEDDWWKSNHLISPTLYKCSKNYSKMYPLFCTP